MKNTLVIITSQKPSCAGFDDEYLYISSLYEHTSFEELKSFTLENGNSGKNGYAMIEIKTIEEVHFHEKAPDLFFRYEKKGRLKKYYLCIKNNEIRTTFSESLAEVCNLKTRTETNNPYSRLGVNSIPVVICGLLTWGCYYGSNGGFSDGRKSIARLMTEVLQSAGPTAVLITGSVVTLFFLLRLVKNILDSDLSVVYSF